MSPRGLESGMCGFDGAVDIGGHTFRNGDEFLACRRVDHTRKRTSQPQLGIYTVSVSLDGLGILVGGRRPLAIDVKADWDLDLAFIGGMIELMSEDWCHDMRTRNLIEKDMYNNGRTNENRGIRVTTVP